ncbi:protein unc-119 homolog B-like [Oscarella lobularis]|uniref:protein unc-119 homolog B-like n=1 Tax=Oscarella lobularis TaxID=121494 RepID=UPI0033135CB5
MNKLDAAMSGSASGSSKKSGSYLARQKAKKAGGVVTEEDLRKKAVITPTDVTKLSKMTKDYLCRLEDNSYGIEFTRFRIRDMGTGTMLFEVGKPPGGGGGGGSAEDTPTDDDPNAGRYVRYEFPPQFLKLRQIGATVEFVVGDKPVEKFRMIERHYFRDQLLKSFDFEFGFCIPGSTNTCEHIYEFPQLSDEQVQEMIDHPFETASDSFYFVNDKLIMQNKAFYSYKSGHE